MIIIIFSWRVIMSNEKESFVSFVKQLQKEKTDDVIQIFDRKVCIDYRNRFIFFDAIIYRLDL